MFASSHTLTTPSSTHISSAFCATPFLGKRPRPLHCLLLNIRTPRALRNSRPAAKTSCCAFDASDSSLARKVESTLLASEQVSDLAVAIDKTSPPVLPVALDLINYHARVAARRRSSRDVALRLYRRGVKLNPSDGRAWLGLARVEAAMGEKEAARKTFRCAVVAAPRNPFLLQAWGVFEERAGNLGRAKELYLAALREDDSHAPAWVALGLWQQRHGRDIASARAAFRRGAEADPSNYYIWHVWGVLEKNCRRYPRARECFQKGVAANPANAATYVLWGSLEDELGNSQIAMNLFQRAHTVSPRNVYAYLSHAVAAEKIGDFNKARSLLCNAISIRPNDAAPRQALGLLEFRLGDLEASRKMFSKAVEKDPRHGPSWHAWARVECAVGSHVRARKLFQEAVWAAPRSPHVVRTWHSWAMMEMSLGCFSAARRFFSHGLDVDSKSVVLLTGMAELEAKEGDMTRSRECMEQSVRLEPWRQSTWRLYQRLEMEYGSARRAQLVYERSVVIGQQVEERYKLSDPLPGDFQGSGMWIDALELPPDKSAFDSIGARSRTASERSPVQGRTSRKKISRKPQNKVRPVRGRSETAEDELGKKEFKQGLSPSGTRAAIGF